MQETQKAWDQSLGQEDPLEKGMATHSNILAWRIPWTEETGGLLFLAMSDSSLQARWGLQGKAMVLKIGPVTKCLLCPARLLCLWDSPGKNIGVGCHSLLQGIFPTRGLCRGAAANPRFPRLLPGTLGNFPGCL